MLNILSYFCYCCLYANSLLVKKYIKNFVRKKICIGYVLKSIGSKKIPVYIRTFLSTEFDKSYSFPSYSNTCVRILHFNFQVTP